MKLVYPRFSRLHLPHRIILYSFQTLLRRNRKLSRGVASQLDHASLRRLSIRNCPLLSVFIVAHVHSGAVLCQLLDVTIELEVSHGNYVPWHLGHTAEKWFVDFSHAVLLFEKG